MERVRLPLPRAPRNEWCTKTQPLALRCCRQGFPLGKLRHGAGTRPWRPPGLPWGVPSGAGTQLPWVHRPQSCAQAPGPLSRIRAALGALTGLLQLACAGAVAAGASPELGDTLSWQPCSVLQALTQNLRKKKKRDFLRKCALPSAFKALFLALDSFPSKLCLVLTLPSYCLHVFPPGLELFLGGFRKPEVAGRGEGGSTCPCLLRSVALDLVGVLGSWLLRVTPSVLTFLFRFYYFFSPGDLVSLFAHVLGTWQCLCCLSLVRLFNGSLFYAPLSL